MLRVLSIVLMAMPCSCSSLPAIEPSACAGLYMGTPPEDHADIPTEEEYSNALDTLDVEALKADMLKLLTESQECWPADYGNYGPFFVRLAWHCSGSYRQTDGKGGCGGGRQRFEPERSWPDNTNLDKARALLYPLKKKYGHALSWGDLFITAGSVAARSMGAPVSQLCFGRIDDADGTKSLELGPSPEQQQVAPCKINGQCKKPLGSTTVGLIYLNPEGPVMEQDGKPNPDPTLSAKDVRDSFERMNHSDRATVALIGGGHAFGKTHGACPKGPGPAPNEAYNMTPRGIPWPGLCGTGKGKDAFTSGFEGPWTTKPLKWDNEFFKFLLEHEWEKHIGPAGHWQWRVKDAPSNLAGIMRLTSDMALLHDAKYLSIVKEFAEDMHAFDTAFDDAWFRLTTANGARWSKAVKCDMGAVPEEIRSVHSMLTTDMLVV
jgi:catalase (peroxidase I)